MDNAWRLVPNLRQRLIETEEIRQLPDATMQEASEAAIFSLLLPRSLVACPVVSVHIKEVLA